MSTLWLVAWHEYKRHVMQRRFIVVVLSVPLMIAAVAGLGLLSGIMSHDATPIGYVDHSGLLADPVQVPATSPLPLLSLLQKPVPLVPYRTEEAAREALEASEIQAYCALAADYAETRRVELVYVKPPSENATREFGDFLRANLLASEPPEIARRAAAGSHVVVRSPDGSREFSGRPTLGALFPLLVSLAFIILLFSSSGYLMQAVVTERENRTMEILVTSISPGQLITGKVFGIMAVGLTQLAAWTAFAGLGVLGGCSLGLDPLRDLNMDLETGLAMIAVFVAVYVIVAALMTAVGATIADAQEGQQIAALFGLPFQIPVLLLGLIAQSPNSPLAVGLTLFPLTSLAAVGMRAMFTTVPFWQIAASVAIMVPCALGALWLAGRAFRLGMLRYGRRLDWRELLGGSAVRSGGSNE